MTSSRQPPTIVSGAPAQRIGASGDDAAADDAAVRAGRRVADRARPTRRTIARSIIQAAAIPAVPRTMLRTTSIANASRSACGSKNAPAAAMTAMRPTYVGTVDFTGSARTIATARVAITRDTAAASSRTVAR